MAGTSKDMEGYAARISDTARLKRRRGALCRKWYRLEATKSNGIGEARTPNTETWKRPGAAHKIRPKSRPKRSRVSAY